MFREKTADVPREATRTTHKFSQFTKMYISSALILRRSIAPGLIFVLAGYLGYRFLVETGRNDCTMVPLTRPHARTLARTHARTIAPIVVLRSLINCSDVPCMLLN